MTNFYQKLIRDREPEIAKENGEAIQYHYATTDQEFEMMLIQKFQSEFSAFSKKPNIENMASVLDVIDAIITLKNFDHKEIDAIRENNAIEYGLYEDRIILDSRENGQQDI
jgi:predicted house-cleaning noncanonical NTP pyrophosphatase (MazG superfamily)